MRQTRRIGAALSVLLLGLTLWGCASHQDEPAPSTKVLEHTDSKPPPGIVDKMQQQAQEQAKSATPTPNAGK